MKLPWFKRNGIFFIPTSAVGWMLFVGALVAAVFLFVKIDSHSHSASDTLRPFVISLLIIGIVYSAIAFFTSKPLKE